MAFGQRAPTRPGGALRRRGRVRERASARAARRRARVERAAPTRVRAARGGSARCAVSARTRCRRPCGEAAGRAAPAPRRHAGRADRPAGHRATSSTPWPSRTPGGDARAPSRRVRRSGATRRARSGADLARARRSSPRAAPQRPRPRRQVDAASSVERRPSTPRSRWRPSRFGRGRAVEVVPRLGSAAGAASLRSG